MAKTIIYRKCAGCAYFESHGNKYGWCSWIGCVRVASQEECEDGYTNKLPGKKNRQ